MKLLFLSTVASLVLFSCEKKEIPIKPFDRGGVITNVAAMGNNYAQHVFFNLDSNKIVGTVRRMDWDIAFDCSENTHIILLNNGRGVYAAATLKTDLQEVNDTVGMKFQWGQPSLDLDSLAFGKWWLESPKVFVLNLGLDDQGLSLGFIKCIPELTADKSLKIKWCSLDKTNYQTAVISKNDQFNFNYFSLLNSKPVSIEPEKNLWDLWFTQYTKLVYSSDFKIFQNYQLTGVLINPYSVKTAQEFKIAYEEILNPDFAKYTFSTVRDGIGYEWKTFSFATNAYVVNPKMNYLIQLRSGFNYKLHFVDFYNESGVKGYPKFEFQKL